MIVTIMRIIRSSGMLLCKKQDRKIHLLSSPRSKRQMILPNFMPEAVTAPRQVVRKDIVSVSMQVLVALSFVSAQIVLMIKLISNKMH
jgi:hypothetical protein